MTEHVRRIGPGDRSEGAVTPGMTREEAVANDHVWAGLVRTTGGMVSGWHHHGANETVFYVVSGTVRMESGPGGTEVTEAHANDFVHVSAGVVHRESNPTGEESVVIVFRAGSGPSVINVDGPAQPA